jgi:hypothetical protein
LFRSFDFYRMLMSVKAPRGSQLEQPKWVWATLLGIMLTAAFGGWRGFVCWLAVAAATLLFGSCGTESLKIASMAAVTDVWTSAFP